MILHHRDYEFDETQRDKPLGEAEARTLCGRDLRPLLLSREESIAFFWCPIEKINCEECRATRERLVAAGRWPEE